MTETLQNIETAIDRVMAELEPAVLPKAVKVPPNQHSWPETAAAMIGKAKTRKKINTDPYSGGERSGKKARSDAKGPRKATTQ
jgi:hypothetical protein